MCVITQRCHNSHDEIDHDFLSGGKIIAKLETKPYCIMNISISFFIYSHITDFDVD